MIVLVQGSNRRGNATAPVTDFAAEHLAAQGLPTATIDLVELPGSVLHGDMYEASGKHDFLDEAAALLGEARHWVFAFPEYNGSFPGALKLFIDALSVRDYKTLFGGKTAALIGTASGRAGNLRGIDHLTAVLHHLGTSVMPQAMPISLIDGLVDGGQLTDAGTREALGAFLDRFVDYASQPVAAAH